ncbi:MAG: phosphatase PAP2 family protein [Bacteroidetes bacterium]|nr:phosphatase PAP2 family protein [Bacteroidota bacterium]
MTPALKSNAQVAAYSFSNLTYLKTDSTIPRESTENITAHRTHFSKLLLIPATMIVYGVVAIKNPTLRQVNHEFKDEAYLEAPHAPFHLDNYLMYVPAASVYALNAVGIKGKNNFFDRSMIYILSNVILATTVTSVKNISHQLRPDSSDYLSFPSGHTAEAFASAEFMRMEYKDVSLWYGVAGYAMAAFTGYLRMYNNKHWFSDVVAGAGVGILSTDLSYFLYPKIKKLFTKKNKVSSFAFPFYHESVAGIVYVHHF